MDRLSPNVLVRGDVVVMQVTVGRYWDDSENGRIKNWDSSRVYFQLEAVSLLVNCAEDVDNDTSGSPGPSGSSHQKKRIVF